MFKVFSTVRLKQSKSAVMRALRRFFNAFYFIKLLFDAKIIQNKTCKAFQVEALMKKKILHLRISIICEYTCKYSYLKLFTIFVVLISIIALMMHNDDIN